MSQWYEADILHKLKSIFAEQTSIKFEKHDPLKGLVKM